MLDKIQFWFVLVWMVAMLVMAIWAVREEWKEDSRQEMPDPDAVPPGTDTRESGKPHTPGAGQ